jgi:TPR repeat protein
MSTSRLSQKPSIKKARELYASIKEKPSEPGNYIDNYEDAFEMFSVLPKDKKGEIDHYLFECYTNGRGTPSNQDKAFEHLSESCKKNYWKARLDLALIKIKNNIGSNFNVDMLNEITDDLKLALQNAPNDSAKVEVSFQILLHLLFTYEREITPSNEIKQIFQTQIYKTLCDLVNYNHGPALYLSATILQKPTFYHNLGVDYSKKFRDPNYSIEDHYLKAALNGYMRASKCLAELYYDKKNYENMTWWYWWHIFYQKTAIIKSINKIIIQSEELTTLYKNMSDNYIAYKSVHKSGDSNVKEYLKKMYYTEQIEKHRKYTTIKQATIGRSSQK